MTAAKQAGQGVEVACPRCQHPFALTRDVPPLPAAISFDCPLCKSMFVVWTHGGEIKVSGCTRTGETRAES